MHTRGRNLINRWEKTQAQGATAEEAFTGDNCIERRVLSIACQEAFRVTT